MTVQELMTRTFQLAGEPSDLCPFTTPGDPTTFDVTLALPGSLPLLGWINQALVRVANWEYRDGTMLRFKSLKKSLYFKTKPALTGDILDGTADTISIDAFNPLNTADQFTGWIVEVTNPVTLLVQKRLVISTTGLLAANSVLQVHQDWDVIPDVTCTFKLYKRFFNFVSVPVAGSVSDYHIVGNANDLISDVLTIRDLISLSDLPQPKQTEVFTSTQMGKAIPSLYLFEGDRITFDTPWDLGRSYQILYYAYPSLLTSVDSAVDIPKPFHEAVLQWVVHALQMRDQDFNGAYATKRDMQELMDTLRNQGEMGLDNEQTGLTVYS